MSFARMFAAARENQRYNAILPRCPHCGLPGDHHHPAFRGEREYFSCHAFAPAKDN